MSGRAKTVLVVFPFLAVVVAVRHIQTRAVALAPVFLAEATWVFAKAVFRGRLWI